MDQFFPGDPMNNLIDAAIDMADEPEDESFAAACRWLLENGYIEDSGQRRNGQVVYKPTAAGQVALRTPGFQFLGNETT